MGGIGPYNYRLICNARFMDFDPAEDHFFYFFTPEKFKLYRATLNLDIMKLLITGDVF